jgi:hypothetical protein
MDTPERSFVPGKPSPNCLEYMMLCDKDYFGYFLVWEKPHCNKKYDTKPDTVRDLLDKVFDQLEHFKANGKNKPFIIYVDARFGLPDLVPKANKRGFRVVMSMSARKFDGKVLEAMRKGLEKREWRVFFHPSDGCYLLVARPKRKTYLQILANHSTARKITTTHHKVKYPKTAYDVHVPQVQKDYNANKMQVDNFNKRVLAYQQQVKFTKTRIAYFHFFVQALTSNTYAYYRHVNEDPLDHYDWRIALVNALFETYGKKKSEKTGPKGTNHYPRPLKEGQRTCDYQKCRNRPTGFCEACDLALCKKHLDEVHLS